MLFFIAFCFLACTATKDPYSESMAKLADESQSFKPAIEETLKSVDLLPADGATETFTSSKVTEDAYQLLKIYPSNPPPVSHINRMMLQGVPDSADQRVVIKARRKALFRRVTPYLYLCRRLINSIEKFNWSTARRRDVGLIIINRALVDSESPGVLLDSMINLVEVKTVLEKKLVQFSPDMLGKIGQLQSAAKDKSKMLNEKFANLIFLPGFVTERYSIIENYFPQFILRRWTHVSSEDSQASEEIENRLKPLLREIVAANKG